jgi:hypothetical protein
MRSFFASLVAKTVARPRVAGLVEAARRVPNKLTLPANVVAIAAVCPSDVGFAVTIALALCAHARRSASLDGRYSEVRMEPSSRC